MISLMVGLVLCIERTFSLSRVFYGYSRFFHIILVDQFPWWKRSRNYDAKPPSGSLLLIEPVDPQFEGDFES